MPGEVVPPPAAELESNILAVLLHAESARSAAAALLDALRPVIDDVAVALAVRDRDGTTLHVLAEVGAPQRWPRTLPPRVAVSAESAVDPSTSTMLVPLHANGRVCGALIFGDTAVASELLHGDTFPALLAPLGEVLHVVLALTDAAVRRRALAIRSIDRVVDGMAHQIANPLTGASAMAQLLLDELENPEQRAALRQMREEMDRAFAVVSDILAFHRDTRAQDGVLDLNTVVERVVRFRGYSIREQGIALTLETLADYAPVRVDAAGFEHALLSALRFAELQSQSSVNRVISVSVVARGERELAVEILDSGIGRVPEIAPRYFDLSLAPDDRERDREDEPDLGLIDGILRAGGGALQISASKTSGTTLALILPRAMTHPAATQRRTGS